MHGSAGSFEAEGFCQRKASWGPSEPPAFLGGNMFSGGKLLDPTLAMVGARRIIIRECVYFFPQGLEMQLV